MTEHLTSEARKEVGPPNAREGTHIEKSFDYMGQLVSGVSGKYNMNINNEWLSNIYIPESGLLKNEDTKQYFIDGIFNADNFIKDLNETLSKEINDDEYSICLYNGMLEAKDEMLYPVSLGPVFGVYIHNIRKPGNRKKYIENIKLIISEYEGAKIMASPKIDMGLKNKKLIVSEEDIDKHYNFDAGGDEDTERDIAGYCNIENVICLVNTGNMFKQS